MGAERKMVDARRLNVETNAGQQRLSSRIDLLTDKQGQSRLAPRRTGKDRDQKGPKAA